MSLAKPSKNIDKKYVNAFSAIIGFVSDLWEVFQTKQTSPLALYRRLTEHITFTNVDGIMKTVSGFEEFFKKYESLIVSNKLAELPQGTVINYHDGRVAYLEIQKYIHKSDESTCHVIREHLLTIRAILYPTPEAIAQLTEATNSAPAGELKISTDTKEGKFINDIMTKTKATMEGVNLDNPMTAMMALMQSGVVNDLVSGLNTSISSGEMDMNKLFSTMQQALGSIMPPPSAATAAAPSIEEIKDVVPAEKK